MTRGWMSARSIRRHPGDGGVQYLRCRDECHYRSTCPCSGASTSHHPSPCKCRVGKSMTWGRLHPPEPDRPTFPTCPGARPAILHSESICMREGGRVFGGGSWSRGGWRDRERRVVCLVHRAGSEGEAVSHWQRRGVERRTLTTTVPLPQRPFQ